MRLGLALIILLAGCDFVWRIDHFDPAAADATDGAGPDAACTMIGKSGGKGLIQVCVPNDVPDDVTLADGLSSLTDCNAGFQPQDDNTKVCLVIAKRIHVSAAVDTKGGNPLVLVGVESIEIGGNLNVSASANTKGPGSDYLLCGAGTNGTGDNNGGGGGAGGSFGTAGGDGGDGKALIARGGHHRLGLTPTTVRGGCSGGNGGDGHLGSTRGIGASSGGAVYMISNGVISVTANINASGAGGGAGLAGGSILGTDGPGGGGGGGSGGMIAFDAPSIMIDPGALIFANGGGGGSSGADVLDGVDGSDPSATTWNIAASGGLQTGAAAGGTGGANSAPGASGVKGAKAGGGGGGGGGYILVYTSSVNAQPFQASPPVMINP